MVCDDAVFSITLLKLRLEELTLSVDTVTFNCRAKVAETLAAVAVSVVVCAFETEETVAEKLALVAPAATVTDEGTMTAVLLLARVTAKPPVAAAAFRVTEHVSVPAPVIDELVQEIVLSTGTPVPVRLIVLEAPEEELLARVSAPVAAPADIGSN